MSLEMVNGNHVHYPKRRDVFVFDDEVSIHFEEMAMRSIPMYNEAHRLHISMFKDVIEDAENSIFYDVGASRGHFFKELCNQFQIDPATGDKRFTCVAIDSSPHMLQRLKEELPWVHTVESDALCLGDFAAPADFISMFYLLQFLETDAQKLKALKWAHRNLRQGGVLFLGQKDLTTDTHTARFADEYYRFRMDNGYTIEEIRAKTEALKNSMWPSHPEWLGDLCLQAGFSDYVETTRWLTFSTSMCTR